MPYELMSSLLKIDSPYSGVDLTELSDEELVAICNQELPESTRAYRVLIRRYEGLIYNTCKKLLQNVEDAEEVAQDTFIQLFNKLHQFQGRSSFKTWLYRIVHNFCKNRISKQIRHRKGKEAIEDYSSHFVPDAYENENTEKNERSELVNAALEKLKPREREIIVLKFMSGLTIEEIANVLDLGLSATKMRLYRGLDAFKVAYQRVSFDAPKKIVND